MVPSFYKARRVIVLFYALHLLPRERYFLTCVIQVRATPKRYSFLAVFSLRCSRVLSFNASRARPSSFYLLRTPTMHARRLTLLVRNKVSISAILILNSVWFLHPFIVIDKTINKSLHNAFNVHRSEPQRTNYKAGLKQYIARLRSLMGYGIFDQGIKRANTLHPSPTDFFGEHSSGTCCSLVSDRFTTFSKVFRGSPCQMVASKIS